MTNVLPDTFVKKSTAEELLPRSGRQLTRDISKAVARRDIDALKCFQLRMLDETIIEGVEIGDIGVVKQLGLDGRGPEWYVDVESWRSVLSDRARSRTRPAKAQQPTESVDPSVQNKQDESDRKDSHENEHSGNNYVAELLNEKDLRIKELKDSKDYLERLLERLIGKDTLKALADIVGNESVNSNQLATLIKSTSTESNAKPETIKNEAPAVVENKTEAKTADSTVAESSSGHEPEVIDVAPTVIVDAQKAKPAKKKSPAKKRVSKTKSQASKAKAKKKSRSSNNNKKKSAPKPAKQKSPKAGIKNIWNQFFRS